MNVYALMGAGDVAVAAIDLRGCEISGEVGLLLRSGPAINVTTTIAGP